MTHKIFIKSKKISKNASFMLISNPLKKFEKNAPIKVIGKTDLTNMSKNEKMHISITFLLIIYFLCIFLIVSMDL